MKLTPILMPGGGGTRLWPLSREHYPTGTYLGEDDIVRYDDDFGR